MTNREKFRRVFGFIPDESCVLPCPRWNIFRCPWRMSKGKDRGCHGNGWWDQEYDGHTMIPKEG